jgi:hypothetical protein
VYGVDTMAGLNAETRRHGLLQSAKVCLMLRTHFGDNDILRKVGMNDLTHWGPVTQINTLGTGDAELRHKC